MPQTTQAIGPRASRRIAREFVSSLATLDLLEHVTRFESIVLTDEDTRFMRTFASPHWAHVFGNVVKHDVLCVIGGHGVESLGLTALDGKGRPLLTRTFQVTANDHLKLVARRCTAVDSGEQADGGEGGIRTHGTR